MIGSFAASVLILGSLTGPRGAQAPAPHPTRTQLYRALLAGKVPDRDRALVHLAIGNAGPEGNVLTFTNRGREVAVSHLEATDLPLPPTRKRKSDIQ
jgi:hypothetical protein